MRNPFRRKPPTDPNAGAWDDPTFEPYATCETVRATATSPVHVRVVPTGQPLHPNGGLHVNAVCGRDLDGGWDLHWVTTATVANLSRVIPSDQPGHLCRHCVAIITDQPLTDEADLIDAHFDRSAGRDCRVCGRAGSHHTDKHAEFYVTARQHAHPVA